MPNIRNRIETGFSLLAQKFYTHRFKTLLITTVVMGALFSQLPKVKLDTSMEGFLHPDDPALLTYNQFRDQFGRDEVIIVAIESDKIFDFQFLNTLKSLHKALEANVPYLDDVTSLINARNTRGNGDALIVEDLLETWPRSENDLQDIKRRAMANPMYRNMLLSEDGRCTTLIVRSLATASAVSTDEVLDGFDEEEIGASTDGGANGRFLSDAQNTAIVMAVNRIVDKYRSKGLTIYLAGTPVVTHFLKWSMIRDMRKFMVLVVAMVAAALFLMFRRVSGIVLPLLVVAVSFLSTLSLMALAGTAIKIPTQVLPSFVLAVGVGTSVHILSIFYQRLHKKDAKSDAIVHAMGHSGLAILMTNITTAAGLVSFIGADVAPVADLGIFAGIGVMLSFVYTVILLPALVAVSPIKAGASMGSSEYNRRIDRLLESISRIATDNPRKIIMASTVIILLSVAGATQIRFSHHPLKWFPKDNIIRKDTEAIDRIMRGSMTIEVVLDTQKENGWYDPDRLQQLEAAIPVVEKMRHADNYVGKAFTLTAILKEINQALNENRSDAYTVPDDRDLIAQEFLLFENSGSDDLEDFVDSQFSKVRFTMKFPFKDAVHHAPFLKMCKRYFDEKFPDLHYDVTGMISLLARTISNTITSLTKSYAIAMAVITILMVLLIGRVRIGMLSMIPNLVPILLTLGIIGALGFPMDMFTMMVASIAIGLAVDDTIHFMHNFRRYYEATGDPRLAVFKTLHTTGRAMLVTTIVLSLGFFIYMFSTLNNIIRFGFLTGITLIAALLADYFLAPALMVLVNKQQTVDDRIRFDTAA
ncbi:MAG: efflux RND transporter permease subunit [Desulfobacteraceae bacterium]|jgi:predicted RND superfamily exporter protein